MATIERGSAMMCLTDAEVLEMLRKECSVRGGAKAFAERAGVTEAAVSTCLNGRMNVGKKIARGFGLKRAWTIDNAER
jgi:DNA-binding transcriptional regulator YdaS (Cro superfamily)